jgi:hypothetical protein
MTPASLSLPPATVPTPNRTLGLACCHDADTSRPEATSWLRRVDWLDIERLGNFHGRTTSAICTTDAKVRHVMEIWTGPTRQVGFNLRASIDKATLNVNGDGSGKHAVAFIALPNDRTDYNDDNRTWHVELTFDELINAYNKLTGSSYVD